ncbi:MAG: hypothetical protein GXO76_01340 [Calditrichaeota bacterium]|nr:hypothetical protein [Calditrichota bacterium]
MGEKKDLKEKESGHYFLIFYWNPKDKRLFVPKRYGIGWTVNFANPFSILMFVAILIITAFLANLF